jgi:hypothetical protein
VLRSISISEMREETHPHDDSENSGTKELVSIT